jgi:hypothetical protein
MPAPCGILNAAARRERFAPLAAQWATRQPPAGCRIGDSALLPKLSRNQAAGAERINVAV